MNLELIASLLRDWAAIPWAWDRLTWTPLVARLGLVEKLSNTTGPYGRTDFEDMDDARIWAMWHYDKVVCLDVELASWLEGKQLDSDEQDAALQASRTAFALAVDETRKALGIPAFNGSCGDSGFPEDESAELIALWMLPNVRVMVQWVHADMDTPIAVLLVFAPPI